MTPAERSRLAVPSEWNVEPTAHVLWLIADEYAEAPPEEDPILVWLIETEPEPENWPVLPDDPEPRLERALRIMRNGLVYALVVAVLWGLVFGLAWVTWNAAVALS